MHKRLPTLFSIRPPTPLSFPVERITAKNLAWCEIAFNSEITAARAPTVLASTLEYSLLR